MTKKILLSFLLLIVFNTFLKAHAPDQSYLYLRVYEKHIEGTVEITLKDINKALGVNIDYKKYLAETPEDKGEYDVPVELEQYLPRIQAYILQKVGISSKTQGKHNMEFITPKFLVQGRFSFIRTNFKLDNVNEIPDELDIRYEVLLDEDPIQRGYMVVGHNWKAGVINNESMTSLIFTPTDRQQKLNLKDASIWKGFVALIKLGMWHIYIGLDHILFLLALVLPSVVRRRMEKPNPTLDETWRPVDNFKDAFFYILKVVTLFTIAHSITLSLAALGWINLSSRIVESIIALSIALAAYLNMKPLFNRRESVIAFSFGLFHGLGFASVLGEKGLGGEYLSYSLLGFNIGVEIGQILIIIAMFPILFLLRKSKLYPKIIYYGSILLIIIAFYWFIERFFEIDMPIDNFIGRVVAKLKSLVGL
jgi:hydrogenase/urease accessory protein HupE